MLERVTVLGIESSCDETAAAIVELEGDRLRVRSSVVGSQTEVHAPYGGVVPELASRAHLERMLPILRAALAPLEGVDDRARLRSIDAIAVGSRPGLIGSLLVGTSAAKALAWSLGKPFLGVDHVAAHLVAAMLDAEPIPFPALGLVVSGGHTSLFLMRDALTLEPLLRTPDDAVGEAFDKGAALLGLPYPGGPEVEGLAARGRSDAVSFPVPKLDFSFSGLKTALLYEARGVPTAPGRRSPAAEPPPAMTDARRADLAASYQRALVKAVTRGVEHAYAKLFDGQAERSSASGHASHRRTAAHDSVRTPPQTSPRIPSSINPLRAPRALVVGGGVAANQLLREEIAKVAHARSLELRIAPMRYCVDNAAMIAGLGAIRAARGERDGLELAPQPLSELR